MRLTQEIQEKLKLLLFSLFFLSQVYLVITRIDEEEKFFNWAMYHTDIRYTVTVFVNGIELSNNEFTDRYKFSRTGQECRGLGNLKRKMILREKCNNDDVVIELDFKENTFKSIWKWQSNR